MFDALSKELYSLKQGSGENVAKFGVHLSQQVQILQSEYVGRIQQEHVEEMKRVCFYEGLNPKYQQMLAHKVDGEHPVRYSYLLLAAWKLERKAEARDPLLLKTTTTGGLNVTHSQTSGKLFPSQKLKGSYTSTAQSTMVETNDAEEDSGAKTEEEEEAESSPGEDTRTLSGAEEWISWLGILSILPTWSSCIRGKIKIGSDVVVLTISRKIVWKILARLCKKQV